MGVQLLLQSAALPLLAVLLSWRWPRWQWLFAALAMLGVAQWLEPYAWPGKAWQWLPALLLPALFGLQANHRIEWGGYAVLTLLLGGVATGSLLATAPEAALLVLPAILAYGVLRALGDTPEGLGFALAFLWLALVIGIDGSLLIAQLSGALAALAGLAALRALVSGPVSSAGFAAALAMMQLLAWQYVEVPLKVLLPTWILVALDLLLRNQPVWRRWAVLIVVGAAGIGVSLWAVWPTESLY
ncbi:MAG: hypothetical protein ACRC8D_03865 [Aeromonas sp.]